MRREALWFRATASWLTAVTAFFLCDGPRAAAATRARHAHDAQRAKALAALKVDAQLLDNPDAFHAAEAAKAKLKREAALKRARAFAHADAADAKAKAARDFAAAMEAKAVSQRVVRTLGVEKAKGKGGAALKSAVVAAVPEFKTAKAPATHPAPSRLHEREPMHPVPSKPRLKGARGELTPELKSYYASVVGEGATVLEDDGELRPVEELAFGYRTPKPQRLVASLASDFELGLFAALPAPTADDLAETPETVRTPEIVALSQSLNGSSLALYNQVHTSIAPQLYWGSKKGAAATLREGAGNDFDTSSLLIALLRASGIPARWEHGVVRLSLAQAQALTGADTLEHAAYLIGYTGAPTSVDGNTILTERVWVRAYVPYSDYKGTGPGGDSLWVRLDPGMKLVSWNHPVSLRGLATFDSAAYLAAPNTKTPQEVYEAQLLAAAKAKSVCNNLSDALAAPTLTQPALSLLPGEHPAKVESSLLVFAKVPVALQWTVGITLGSHSKSFTVAELQYQKLALRYPGATPADDAAIQAAGGILNVAPFQVQVAGSLRLNGVEVQRFDSAMPGESQVLTVSITGPNAAPVSLNHRLHAGAVYTLALYAGVADAAYADALKAAVRTTASDDNSEAAGYAAAALYATQQQRSAQRMYGLQAHATFQDVLEAVAGRELTVQEAFGIPVALAPGLYTIDVGRDALTPVAMDADASEVASLVELSGTQGSVLEARSWETIFANTGIATVPVIQQAHAQGMPVFTFNGGAATGLTGYTQSSLDDVSQALAANWRVTIPQHPVTLPGYVNVEAYILFNPVDGSGSYVINHTGGGGNNGGSGGGGIPNGPNCACGTTNSIVNFANGRFQESYTDLSLPAVGLPIAFTRHYASDFKTLTPLGVGWLHSYGMSLRTEANGDMTFVMEDTTEVRFVKTGSTFAIPVGWYFTLTPNAGGFRVRAKEGYVWQFDGTGRLASMQDTSGNTTTLTYSGGLLATVKDSSGAVALSFTYTGNKLTSVTDRAGRTVSYGYTGDDLTSATDVLNHIETYGYDDRHLLTSRIDRRGATWHSVFDAFGRWSSTVDANGNGAHAVYDAVHLTTVLFDMTGAPWRTVMNAAGNPIEKTSPLGETTKTTWVAEEPTATVDGRGFTTSMQYDSLGNMLKRTYPDGRVETMTYDPTFNHVLTQSSTGLPNVTNTYDSAGRLKTRNAGLGVTTYNYDTKGQLSTVVEPGPAATTFGHDGNGNVTSILDASNRTTSMGFDAAGHLTSVTDGNNKTRTLEVDAAGRVMASVDATHQRTEFTYDGEGHRLTAKDAAFAVTTFAYDGVGRMTSVTDANGKTSRTEYDALGRVTATTDARGHRSTRAYDAAGRLVSMTDALGNTMTHGYCADLSSAACVEVDALGNVTTREFDEVGRVTTVTDALGRQTTSQYDTGGRLSVQNGPGHPQTTYAYQGTTGLLNSVTTPVLAVTYQYDGRGNRTQVTAGTEVTKYTYDLANRLLTETNPLNQVTTYTYDAAGNRATKLDANGVTTTYGYDDNRRLTSVDFGNGTSYQYAYDTRGNRTLEKGPSHERHLHYDSLNRRDVVDDITFGKQLTYGYDVVGNLLRVSEGGVDNLYEYDARNLLASVRMGTSGKTLFGYDADGRRRFVSRPNGVRTDYAYDEGSELLSMVHSNGGSVLLGFTYAYDAQGNRVSKTREDGTAEVYAYDNSMRLTRVDYGTARTVAYTLDSLGNRTGEAQTVHGATDVVTNFSATFNSFNQLKTRNRSGGGLPAQNVTYNYDNNGNTLNETTASPAAVTSYSWDRDNRLRQVTPLAPGTPTSYAFDANGLRIQRVDSTGTVNYLLDGPSVLEELDGVFATTMRYLNNPQAIDDLVSFTKGGATFWPLTDALGSIYATTDSSGAIAHRYDFDVYGVRADLGGSGAALDVGYTGRWHDADGLVDHRDRQRRPELGGWLQADRAASGVWASDAAAGLGAQSPRNAWMATPAIGRGLSRLAPIKQYAYASRPTMRVDPSGLIAQGCPQDWLGFPLFFGEASYAFGAIVVFAGAYTGLGNGDQLFIVQLLAEAGYFVSATFGFELEWGVGIGQEDGMTRADFDEENFVEVVLQFGPVIGVKSDHGSSVFLGSMPNIGVGVIGGGSELTWIWDQSQNSPPPPLVPVDPLFTGVGGSE